MCGIFGCFSRKGLAASETELLAGSEVAAHRGPDGSGTVWFDTRRSSRGTTAVQSHRWISEPRPTALLCHRRLAINDLSDEALQPMPSADGQVWISFNGEIYNFLELRQELRARGVVFRTTSDTEVILKAYEVWGTDAFPRFFGMWAFVIIDLRSRKMILSRDRFGIKPLYYVRTGDSFAFASEIKQLLELPWVERRLNQGAAFDFLYFEATDCGGETFFEGIHRAPPGHNIIVDLDSGEAVECNYYNPLATEVDVPATPAEAAEKFRALLKESVRIHLRADVPVGSCLSGGLDSSAIAMLTREIAREVGLDVDRHSFSCEFDVPEADEREYTRLAVQAAEVTPHFVQPTEKDLLADLRKLVWHQDEPFGSTSIYAQWSVFRLVRQANVKVVLDGQGADEMLGGYASTMPHFLRELAAGGNMSAALSESWKWSRMQGLTWGSQVPYRTLRRALGLLETKAGATKPEIPWIRPDFAAAHIASSALLKTRTATPFGPAAHFRNALYQFFYLNNLPALLRFEDRNSMAFSVEARVPFLDHRLVEYAFALPSHFKVRGGYTKRVLRDSMQGTLPEQIRMRTRKMGFATPERRWQQGPLRPLVEEAIRDPRLQPFIDRASAVEHFRRVCEEGQFSFAPWRWLNMSLWMREFSVR